MTSPEICSIFSVSTRRSYRLLKEFVASNARTWLDFILVAALSCSSVAAGESTGPGSQGSQRRCGKRRKLANVPPMPRSVVEELCGLPVHAQRLILTAMFETVAASKQGSLGLDLAAAERSLLASQILTVLCSLLALQGPAGVDSWCARLVFVTAATCAEDAGCSEDVRAMARLLLRREELASFFVWYGRDREDGNGGEVSGVLHDAAAQPTSIAIDEDEPVPLKGTGDRDDDDDDDEEEVVVEIDKGEEEEEDDATAENRDAGDKEMGATAIATAPASILSPSVVASINDIRSELTNPNPVSEEVSRLVTGICKVLRAASKEGKEAVKLACVALTSCSGDGDCSGETGPSTLPDSVVAEVVGDFITATTPQRISVSFVNGLLFRMITKLETNASRVLVATVDAIEDPILVDGLVLPLLLDAEACKAPQVDLLMRMLKGKFLTGGAGADKLVSRACRDTEFRVNDTNANVLVALSKKFALSVGTLRDLGKTIEASITKAETSKSLKVASLVLNIVQKHGKTFDDDLKLTYAGISQGLKSFMSRKISAALKKIG